VRSSVAVVLLMVQEVVVEALGAETRVTWRAVNVYVSFGGNSMNGDASLKRSTIPTSVILEGPA
jgi:hypothetical protein